MDSGESMIDRSHLRAHALGTYACPATLEV